MIFIFEPGEWVGEGEISFFAGAQKSSYRTKWEIHPIFKERVLAVHSVFLKGVDEPIMNFYRFSSFEEGLFKVEMENILFGKVEGAGLIETDRVKWEFTETPHFRGFEEYTRLGNGSYRAVAAYTSGDGGTSQIVGTLQRNSPII